MSAGGAASFAPTILATTGLEDYALLDSGGGRKLERFGAATLDRPEEQAIWTPRRPAAEWDRADAAFTGDTDEEGAGRWRVRSGGALDGRTAWTCRHGAIRYECRLTSFRHVGAFPEQEAHFARLRSHLAGRERASALNLFAYTGVASLVAAAAGAEVTHVDASKKAIAWARDNADLSGMAARPIRWILDDAGKFAAREVRRGRRYDAVLLDPPKYGRGPKGEVFDLFRDLPDLLRLCRDLVAPGGLLILTAYAIRASFLSLQRLCREVLAERGGGEVEAGELALVGRDGKLLATSLFCRCTAP